MTFIIDITKYSFNNILIIKYIEKSHYKINTLKIICTTNTNIIYIYICNIVIYHK